MLANDQKAIIEAEVEQHLPDMNVKPNPGLYAMIGKEMVPQDVSTLSQSEVERSGEDWFKTNIQENPRIRTAICENIDDILKTGDEIINVPNVTALVAVIAPILGLRGIAIPAAAIAVCVLLFRIGLKRYCRGYSPNVL